MVPKRHTIVIARVAGRTDKAYKMKIEFKPTVVNPPATHWLPMSMCKGIQQFAEIDGKRYIKFYVDDGFLRQIGISPSQLKEPYTPSQMKQVNSFVTLLTTVVRVGVPKVAITGVAINKNHYDTITKSLAMLTDEKGRPFPSVNFKFMVGVYNRGAVAFKKIKQTRPKSQP